MKTNKHLKLHKLKQQVSRKRMKLTGVVIVKQTSFFIICYLFCLLYNDFLNLNHELLSEL